MHAIASNTPDTHDNRQTPLGYTCLMYRLVGSGYSIGHDRDVCKFQPGSCQPLLIDRAESLGRDYYVTGKTALNVVARHLLATADSSFTSFAKITLSARNNRRDDHRLIQPVASTITCSNYAATDFMSQSERQLRIGPYAIVVKTQIGMAHSASGNLDNHLILTGLSDKILSGQRLIYIIHHPTVSSYGHSNFSCELILEPSFFRTFKCCLICKLKERFTQALRHGTGPP